MLTNRTLSKINNRPREVGRVPLLAVGGGTLVLAALSYAYGILPYFAVLAIVGGGALLVLLLYRTQKAKMTVRLSYKGNLDEKTSRRFSEIQRAVEGLASSGKVWEFAGGAKRPRQGEATGPIPPPERDSATVGLLATPGIKADVPVWGIEAGKQAVYFLPEGALLYADDRYEPISYPALEVAFSSRRYFEEEDLPEDADVVDRVWRFSRPDGSPDPRYKLDNVQIPVVLYGLLDVGGPFGLEMHLGVSDRFAAARFARTFGAEVWVEEPEQKDSGRSSSGEGEGERRSAEEIEREARLAAARKTLGVAKGAGSEEVSAAYRRLARTYHPDKVFDLEPGAREQSEQRMKEINAAYALIKRQGQDLTPGGVRTG